MIYDFINYIVAGQSAQLGISPPPEWMGSQRHHCPVANNITKEGGKGQGKKPRPLHFPPDFLTNEFLFFQFHCCRAVRTIGDISTPRMNGKLATQLPCCQQHYQEGSKREGTKPRPPHFLPHFLTNKFLIFQLHRCRVVHTIGDLCPQNEWEAGNTIALLPKTLPRRQ
jgi:hypothetical protein